MLGLGIDYFGGGNKAPTLAGYQYDAARGFCFTPFMPKISLGINTVNEIFLNGDEKALKGIVASYGPVVVAVEATSVFQMYGSGILEDATADKTCNSINHAIVS